MSFQECGEVSRTNSQAGFTQGVGIWKGGRKNGEKKAESPISD